MATINDNGFLINNSRVFLRSENINVFPCSRRGQAGLDPLATGSVKYYDPEARLNTERTNRLHTAVNGFKDSFINSYINSTLVFVLAGYHIEVKNFDPADIASALGSDKTLYAHLRLHDNVSLGVTDYFTEMLYRQSDSDDDKNYLDVSYVDGTNSGDFFVGVSFTKDLVDDDVATVHNLPLFSMSDNGWELVQTSLLPKIEHGETADSIKINGDFTVKHGEQISFKVTKDKTIFGPTQMSELTVAGKAQIDGATTVNNDLTAKNLTITDGKVTTPTLDVNKITSKQTEITLDKTLNATAINVSSNASVTGSLTSGSLKTGMSEATSLKVTGESNLANVNTKKTTANELWLEGTDKTSIGQVPALAIVHLTGSGTYQLRFSFGKQITDIPSSPDILPDEIETLFALVGQDDKILTDINGVQLVTLSNGTETTFALADQNNKILADINNVQLVTRSIE